METTKTPVKFETRIPVRCPKCGIMTANAKHIERCEWTGNYNA